MKRLVLIIICAISFTASYAQREVLYSVDIKNFSDSDGDGHGDIKGLREKLNDLQFLGVTAIVLSPVYEADANGEAIGSMEKINPTYGNFKEYRDLIQEVHNRKMKLYQTINLQYVDAKNVWFTDSFKNTKSAYKDYVLYADDKNEKPVYGQSKTKPVTVNLKSPKVAAYYNKALKYWADPDSNGVFYDGADGFVFKDVQDKPDSVQKNGNLLKEFWGPLTAMLKKINPAVQIITDVVETTSFRHSFYAATGADGVVAYKLQEAIKSLDKSKIIIAADSTFKALPAGKYPVLQLEDEVVRLASLPKIVAAKLKILAALNMLIGGKPVIYQGQESGIKEIAATIIDAGYREQQKDKNSLLNYYKELIKIKINPALAVGAYRDIHNSNDKVVSFLRISSTTTTGEKDVALVMINLSAEKQFVTIDNDKDLRISKLKLISSTPNIAFPKGGSGVELTPYGIQVWTMLP